MWCRLSVIPELNNSDYENRAQRNACFSDRVANQRVVLVTRVTSIQTEKNPRPLPNAMCQELLRPWPPNGTPPVSDVTPLAPIETPPYPCGVRFDLV